MIETLPHTPPVTRTETIAAMELAARLRGDEKCELVDVRTPGEFRAEHIAGSRNVPLDRLDAAASATLYAAVHGAPLVLVCASGARAHRAAQRLAHAAGARVLAGGLQAWKAAGLPVVQAGRTWSLERQVRVVAGALVLAGCGVGFAVNPWGYALAAFVGAGLTFAGLTDTCGMGLLLARMPWNR